MTLEELHKLDEAGKAKERYKCKTDLYYFGSEVLDYDFVEPVHQPVCNFFVRKDPSKPLEEQDLIHERLLLDPREHYKTTIDVCDIIQWIIAFPNIRIALFSGTEELVTQIMEMATRHFQLNEKFRFLFFEHAVDARTKLGVQSFTTLARTDWRLREPTITTSTIGSVSVGGHYEVLKFDDVVTPQNTETPEMLRKTISRIASTVPLLVPGGYKDVIGTIYDFSDAHSDAIDKVEEPKLVEEIPFGKIIRTPDLKIFQRSASTMPFERSSTFLFPRHKNGKVLFDYHELMKRRKRMGDVQFGCQYFNDPNWGHSSTFTKELMEKLLIPTQAIPLISVDPLSSQAYVSGKIFITVDIAFSIKKQADRTSIAAGVFDKFGRLYLLDLEVGRFGSDEFLVKLLTMIRKHYPFMGRIGIEKAGGVQLIEPALKMAQLYDVLNKIDWWPTTPTTSKEERVYGLLPLARTGKFFINKDLPFLKDCIEEFVRFPKGKVDIPDSVAMLLNYQGSIDIMPTLVGNLNQQPIQLDTSSFDYAGIA